MKNVDCRAEVKYRLHVSKFHYGMLTVTLNLTLIIQLFKVKVCTLAKPEYNSGLHIQDSIMEMVTLYIKHLPRGGGGG